MNSTYHQAHTCKITHRVAVISFVLPHGMSTGMKIFINTQADHSLTTNAPYFLLKILYQHNIFSVKSKLTLRPMLGCHRNHYASETYYFLLCLARKHLVCDDVAVIPYVRTRSENSIEYRHIK